MPRGLGNVFDICSGIPVIADLAAGTNTGHRVHMRNYETCAVVFHKGVTSAGTDTVVLTLQEHNAASSGTSQNLAVITDYYYKSEASLDGDEAWVEVTQAASATLTFLTGSVVAGTALQSIVVFEIEASSLSAGFEWVSLNIADPGTGGTIPGTVLYVMSGLKIMARPDLLAQPNA